MAFDQALGIQCAKAVGSALRKIGVRPTHCSVVHRDGRVSLVVQVEDCRDSNAVEKLIQETRGQR